MHLHRNREYYNGSNPEHFHYAISYKPYIPQLQWVFQEKRHYIADKNIKLCEYEYIIIEMDILYVRTRYTIAIGRAYHVFFDHIKAKTMSCLKI